MPKRAILTCCEILLIALICALQSKAQEKKAQDSGDAAVQVDERSRPSSDQLRAIAQAIKECPSTESSDEFGTLRSGPPLNVVWDVVPGSSSRAPYMGYIEFTLPHFFAPYSQKCKRGDQDCEARYFTGLTVMNTAKPFQYRYEFDLGPSGVELVRVLNKPESASRTEWQATSLGSRCFEKPAIEAAAKPGPRIPSSPSPPGIAPLPESDVPTNVNIVESGKTFLQVCSAVDTADAGYTKVAATGLCVGYLEGVLGGLSVASALSDGKARRNLSDRANYCPASSVTTLQMLRAVLKYITDNPNESHLPPEHLILAALRKTYPCERK